jgi:hypothetical protein
MRYTIKQSPATGGSAAKARARLGAAIVVAALQDRSERQ